MSGEKEPQEEEEQLDLHSVDDASDDGHDQEGEGEHVNDGQGDESAPKKRLTKSEKKLLARQKHREMLHAAKARKKQQKKEQKQQLRAEKDTASSRPPRTAEDAEEHRATNEERKLRKQKELQTFLQACNNNFEIILDCTWENEHNYQTLSSLVQQIVFCYGANKKAKNPCAVRLFGMGPETKTRLDKLHCPNWKGFHAYEEDFIAHLDDWYSRDPVVDTTSSEPAVDVTTIATAAAAAVSSSSGEEEVFAENIPAVPTKKRQIVYLTSDAEETLETLDPNCAYVIGGIVDRNRLKGITYQKACTHKLRTAKLPIKEWFSLAATHVLTVNHVFEIMLNFQATQSWTDAMNAVLPKRKEAKLLGSANSDDEDDDGEGNDDADVDRGDQPSDAKRPRLSEPSPVAVAVDSEQQRDS